jgi:16S rRNA (guanine966-N2)-methyltransferase
MRVVAGIFKGRTIPFINQKYGNADITSQIVKEALFDIIGKRIKGSSFLDLFSCSGQIGLEAVSRGASSVYMNEADSKRFSFLMKIRKDFELGSESVFLKFDAERCLKKLDTDGISFDFIYLDPPYVKKQGTAPVYDDLMQKIDSFNLLRDGGAIIIQHFSQNIMSEKIGSFVISDSRKYGQNTLTFYQKIDRLG